MMLFRSILPQVCLPATFLPNAIQRDGCRKSSNFAGYSNCTVKNNHAAVSADILGSSHSDEETRRAIRESYQNYGYLFDPMRCRLSRATQIQSRQRNHPGNGTPCKIQEIVEPAAGVKVEIPERLKACLAGQKLVRSNAKRLCNVQESFALVAASHTGS